MGDYSENTANQITCWLYDPEVCAGFDICGTGCSAGGHTVLQLTCENATVSIDFLRATHRIQERMESFTAPGSTK